MPPVVECKSQVHQNNKMSKKRSRSPEPSKPLPVARQLVFSDDEDCSSVEPSTGPISCITISEGEEEEEEDEESSESEIEEVDIRNGPKLLLDYSDLDKRFVAWTYNMWDIVFDHEFEAFIEYQEVTAEYCLPDIYLTC